MARKFIYKLERENAGYDEVDEMVIIAEDVAQARIIASENSFSEGKTVWMRKAKATKIGYAAKGQKVGPACIDTHYG